MKTFIDSHFIQYLKTSDGQSRVNVLFKTLIDEGILMRGEPLQVLFGWPSLLEYLDLGSLLAQFRRFDQDNELFVLVQSALASNAEKGVLIRLYDQIFVECLTHVKALPQINAAFLFDEIQEKRQSLSSSLGNEVFSDSLDRYLTALRENPSYTMHDLILYLAWDRVCIDLAILFESTSSDLNIQNGLEVFKECLLESFQHITADGRTAPGFFRLLETLYAYHMREENLQTYAEDEWLILCQSAIALKPRESLADVFYIDAAVIEERSLASSKEKQPLKVLTFESVDKVRVALSLADYMVEKLKQKEIGWRYTLSPIEVVCLRISENGFLVNTVIRH